MPRAFPFRLDFDCVYRRLQPVTVAGRRIQTLSSEDLLLLLCVHGGKHRWSCLGWIADVAQLVRSQTAMNWELVVGEARRLACERLLDLGLSLAHDLLDAPLPNEIRQKIQNSATVRALGAQVRRKLFRPLDRPRGGFVNTLFHLRIRERWRDGVWSCLDLALTPTLADWTALRLPVFLSFVHFFFRPIRLSAKYARKLFRYSS